MRSLLPQFCLLLALAESAPGQGWPQWGGPNRDFTVRGSGIASKWTAEDPRRLWARPLDGGHSAVVTDGDIVYVVHGEDRQETVTALRAETGKPLWDRTFETRYKSHLGNYDGPHATPVLAGRTLVTVSIDAQVRAFDRLDGSLLWNNDLIESVGLALPQSGYAASPLVWGDLVLLPGLGGPGPGAVALDIRDGRIVWSRHDFLSSHASPILLEFAGRDHAVFHGMNWIYGLEPSTGNALWRHRLRQNAADNVSFTPLWDSRSGVLYVSHRYDDVGMRALRLVAKPEQGFRLDELWTQRALSIEHGNAVLSSGVLVGSHRGNPGVLSALDAETGRQLWRTRIPKANLVAVGEQTLILDENGTLYLARVEPQGLTITGETKLLDYNAWTVPTLAGRRLFARDRSRIVAVELP